MAWLRAGSGSTSTSAKHSAASDVLHEPSRCLKRRRTLPTERPPGTLDAKHFLDGSQLQVFAERCVYLAIDRLGRPAATRQLKVGSVCSGSEMLSVSLDALASALATHGCNLTFAVPFVSEIDATKRRWCTQVLDELEDKTESQACVFGDICGIVSGGSGCSQHKGGCRIPVALDGLVGGFSCKDFSRANQNRKQFNGIDLVRGTSSPGKTADTIKGILEILDHSPPDWLLLENVDAMEDGGSDSAADELLCMLGEKGLDAQAFKLNASDYGLPQSRVRLFIVGVRRPGRNLTIADYDAFFNQVADFLDMFKMGCPPLLDVLLPDSHQVVASELCRRQQRPPKGWESGSINIHRAEWQKHGLRWQGVQAAEADVQSEWHETLCARQKDILAFHQSKNKNKVHKLPGADLGQSISRTPTTTAARSNGHIIAPTLLPGSFLWLSSNTPERSSRPLLGPEALSVQGWPILHKRWSRMLEDNSSSFLQNLAGNAFPGTVVLALVCSIIFAAEVNEAVASAEETTQQEAMGAFELFQRIRE